jgi:hypothetical protein
LGRALGLLRFTHICLYSETYLAQCNQVVAAMQRKVCRVNTTLYPSCADVLHAAPALLSLAKGQATDSPSLNSIGTAIA